MDHRIDGLVARLHAAGFHMARFMLPIGAFSRLRTGKRDVARTEMIRLRSAPGRIEPAADLLLDLVMDMAAKQGLARVNLYQRAGLRTDLAVSLVWNTDPPSNKGDRDGFEHQ
jgi:hypothetical protein